MAIPTTGGTRGSGAWGSIRACSRPARGTRRRLSDSDKASGDVHLRSAQEVRGYHIQGSDEAIGHVEDFIVDDETWEVRYLVIDTSNWWFGKKVLVAPHWASRISWEERKVYVDLSRQAIKNSPEWNATAAVNREYEARLYDYYGRPVYWDTDDRPVRCRHRTIRRAIPGDALLETAATWQSVAARRRFSVREQSWRPGWRK